MNRTDRLYALVEELRACAPRRRSARELASLYEVSARTIERDIGALQQAGVPMQNPTTGQPGAPTNTCGPANPVTPGSSVAAPGSPFNPNGQAGVVYAGNPGTASLANANSTAVVSQYDVACVQLSH